MLSKKIIFFAVALSLVGVYQAVLLCRHNGQWYLCQEIKGKDLEAIRDQGRGFVNYVLTNNLKRKDGIFSEPLEYIDANYWVPAAIKQLNPATCEINHDNIMIMRLRVPRRVALVVFPVNFPQNATEKIIDGLWYWNGDVELPHTNSCRSN